MSDELKRVIKCRGCFKDCHFEAEWNNNAKNLWCHKSGKHITESDIYDMNIEISRRERGK